MRSFALVPAFHLLIATSLLGACVPKRAPHNSQVKILGGRAVAHGDWPSAVALVARRGVPSNTDHWRPFCTGVAVHPRLILTAAHCVSDFHDNPSAWTTRNRVYIGDGGLMGINDNTLAIDSLDIHPAYMHRAQGQDDIAWVRLKSDIPVEQTTPVLDDRHTVASVVKASQTVRLVGFGEREKSADAGIKYEVDAPVHEARATEFFAGGEGIDACKGDSGGPAYTRLSDGSWRVVGLVSRGIVGTNTPRCGAGGWWTLTYPALCWISRSSGIPFHHADCGQDIESPLVATSRPSEFRAMCDDPALPPHARHTIKVLMDALGATSCADTDSRLASATRLNLDATLLSDLGPLRGMPQLEHLSVRHNFIADLSPLATLPKLRVVDIGWNRVTDRGLLAALEQRGARVLGATLQESVADQEPFRRLCREWPFSLQSTLRTLFHTVRVTPPLIEDDYSSNPWGPGPKGPPIVELAWNQRDCDLASLELQRARSLTPRALNDVISDLAPFAGLHNLEELRLTGQPVKSVAPLANLERLRFLDLTGTSVTDLSPLDRLRREGLVIKSESP